MKVLDIEGLRYLWNEIKTYIDEKFETLVNGDEVGY